MPREDVPHPEWWQAPDEQATETEVSELVGAMVTALQPRFVLETGSYHGHTTLEIARALQRNGHGRLVSLEHSAPRAALAKKRLSHLPSEFYEILTVSSMDYTPDALIDFAWLDSDGGDMRYKEFKRFLPWFHRSTIVGIHDTQPGRDERGGVNLLERDGLFRPVHLPTPRGVTFGNVVTNTKRWAAVE